MGVHERDDPLDPEPAQCLEDVVGRGRRTGGVDDEGFPS